MEIKGFDVGNDFLTKEWLQTIQWSAGTEDVMHPDILRLDLIHPLISGNKWLKLEGWIEAFYNSHAKGIVTTGGLWSNFLHACGYACFMHKIPLHVLIKGNANMHNPMLDDLKRWNVEITFIHRHQFYDTSFGQDIAHAKGFFYIPMGGDGEQGEKGVIRWMNALPLKQYDILCCASGTGTTASGIAKSNIAFNNLWVFDPGTGDESIQQKCNELSTLIPEKNIRLFQLKNRFGKLTPALEAFMIHWFNQTNIPLDFVYTAPMCFRLQSMLAAGEMRKECSILIVHTGGLQGNRSHPLLPKG
ncbi:MAG: hypothetical protein MUE99_09455 [Chitinophagaceae bacterium]|nr:hypothetical protein [Chitinophagaceae bacterium]